jgi:hypothetical protein
MTEEQIKHMVQRFLGWRLPENFRPDGGVQFDPDGAKKLDPRNRRYEPYGTNLLDARQAEAMVRHMVEGLPANEIGAAEAEVGRWVYRRIEALIDAKPGTPEAMELAYLARVAESVEEYGEDACAGHSLSAAPVQAVDREEGSSCVIRAATRDHSLAASEAVPSAAWELGHRQGWVVDGPEHSLAYCTVVQKGRRAPVAFVVSLARDDGPEANARLIAAAPELLGALELLVAAMELQEGRERGEIHLSANAMSAFWTGAIGKARAARTKALTGSAEGVAPQVEGESPREELSNNPPPSSEGEG